MIKTLLTAGAALALAAADETASKASLEIAFQNIETQEGAIMAALFADAESYDEGGAPVASFRLQVDGSTVTKRLEDLAPGAYAIRAYHDVDGDGELDTNLFGVPTEPYAFSNNASGRKGPAKIDAAAFSIQAGENAHAINIQ